MFCFFNKKPSVTVTLTVQTPELFDLFKLTLSPSVCVPFHFFMSNWTQMIVI